MVSGVFWFITCLFISEVIIKYLLMRFSNYQVIGIVSVMYLAAHFESIFIIGSNYFALPIAKKFPWNIDVCLLAVPYQALGYYFKEIINNIVDCVKHIITVVAISIVCIMLAYIKTIDYTFDMKYSHYTEFCLDLLMPVISTLLIFIFCRAIEKRTISSYLSSFGANTLLIMYMHIPLNRLAAKIATYGPTVYSAIGIIVPLAFVYLIRKKRLLRILFLGEAEARRGVQLPKEL